MTWNDTVIAHPHLSPTDKLVFHLLIHLGGDSPRTRRQLRRWLGLSDRHLRRVRDQLHAFGFYLPAPSAPLQSTQEPAPEGEDAQVQAGRTCPVEADVHVQTGRTCPVKADIQVHSGRTCPPPDVHVRSADAPTRTLWSSSSEEDVLVKTSTPSSPSPGGTGGEEEEEVPVAFLVAMGQVWKTIAPQEDEEPRDWFCTLYREFGPQIPLAVLRQFALGDRTLSQLRHPSSYKSYFACCCRKAQEESLALPGPFHTVEGLDQAAPPRSQAEFEQDWVALARAHNDAERRRFQLEMERSP